MTGSVRPQFGLSNTGTGTGLYYVDPAAFKSYLCLCWSLCRQIVRLIPIDVACLNACLTEINFGTYVGSLARSSGPNVWMLASKNMTEGQARTKLTGSVVFIFRLRSLQLHVTQSSMLCVSVEDSRANAIANHLTQSSTRCYYTE